MNYQVFLVFLLYVLVVLSIGYLNPQSERTRTMIRKAMHFITGLVLFFLTYYINRPTLLILLAAGTLFSYITYRSRRFNFIHLTAGSSLGTLFYPVGLLLSCLVLYEMPVWYFQITLLLLTISDTMANLAGYRRKGNPRFRLLTEEKSIWGTIAFICTALPIVWILSPSSGSAQLTYTVLAVIAAVHFEIMSHRGSDNLTIPLGSALFFYLTRGDVTGPIFLIAILLVMALASILLFRKKILTRYGSILVHLLGIFYLGILGWDWIIPVVLFFFSSVLFTKINGLVYRKAPETNTRNAWQVFANIAFATLSSILYLITHQDIFIHLYITLVAAVTADTWASELGPVFNRKCYSLADGSIREAGVSGGISLAGTLASLAGSLIISATSCYLFFSRVDMLLLVGLAFSGFAASFIDSLLGAFVEPRMNQIKYFLSRGGADRLSPNDVVNLTASLSATLFFFAFSIVL